ncbi:MAG TPA: hypothetical protein VHD62_05145 [Opitutaceae bacterium]|nr:hypothetical protein [Opitutaceae bacterium]
MKTLLSFGALLCALDTLVALLGGFVGAPILAPGGFFPGFAGLVGALVLLTFVGDYYRNSPTVETATSLASTPKRATNPLAA